MQIEIKKKQLCAETIIIISFYIAYVTYVTYVIDLLQVHLTA